jgi:hypothetical protein
LTVPPPLTPADCDLRAFRDMPLDIGRFRQSDLVTEEEPEAVVAALMLWGAAWHEVPAASVPDNDRWLAKAAGYGRALDAWRKVREGALRGFVLCSDGRLYNRTLAEKACSAWDSRQQYEWRKAGDRHRKAMRKLAEADRTEFPDFDDWKAGRWPESSGGNDDLFRRTDPPVPAENALKGMEGNGREGSLCDDSSESSPREFSVPAAAMKAFRAHRVKIRKPMTDRAEELIGMTLQRIHAEHGHDPTAVINQSIMFGWTGVFPLKEEGSGRANRNGAGEGSDRRGGLARAIDRRLDEGSGGRGPSAH